MRVSVALIGLLGSCGTPQASTLVTLRSNAPVGLFDRVSIEVRRAGEDSVCSGCRRDLPASALAEGASFSVIVDAAAPVLHVTLFRERGRPARMASSVELFGTYADPAADRVEVRLPWQAVAAVRGSWTDPVDLGVEPAFETEPSRACTASVEPDEACIPGGLFWFGDPSLDLFGGVDREGNDERLVVLSPFVLDQREVTAGQFRGAGFTLTERCRSYPDEVAAGCVLWTSAVDYCAQAGKRLPTEAELEYVMGGLESHRYVWGDGAPECGDAVYDGCRYDAPTAPGASARDSLSVGNAVVVDLVGNVGEWASDVWNSTREPCFAAPIMRDPRCDVATAATRKRRPFKGGGVTLDAPYLGAAMRAAVREDNTTDRGVGFRCARDVSP